jgi:hypothetical protein
MQPGDFNIDKQGSAVIQRILDEKEYLRERGIFVNLVKPVVHKGKRIWALGRHIHFNHPAQETFYEFISGVLLHTLGQKWWDENRNSSDPHFVMKCILKEREWRSRNELPENRVSSNRFASVPDGYTRYLGSLAFDVYTLLRAGHIPKGLRRRLRDKIQFQGARYEIAIAAIMSRMGCDLRFLDDEARPSDSRCEFLVTHRESHSKFAVEVKSRHRPGVLHCPGSYVDPQEMRTDLIKLFRKAISQNPGGLPFLIFIEVNHPMSQGTSIDDKLWASAVEAVMDETFSTSPDDPDPFNFVVFTNFTDHFQAECHAVPAEVYFCMTTCPAEPHPSLVLLNRLELALMHFGFVPDLDPEP